MKTYTVLKVNLVGKGYTHIWPTSSEMLNAQAIDNALPAIAPRATGAYIAYSATRLSPNQVIIAIGAFWPQHKDEHGRLGLSFWHGVNCLLPEMTTNDNVLVPFASLFLGMVQRYESAYDQVGEIMASIAQEQQSTNWIDTIVRLALDVPSSISDITRGAVESFVPYLGKLPERANLMVSLPYHGCMTTPYLASLLLSCNDVQRVGGGRILESTLSGFQYVSISKDIPTHKTIDVSSMLAAAQEQRLKLSWFGPEAAEYVHDSTYPKLITKVTDRKRRLQIGLYFLVALVIVLACVVFMVLARLSLLRLVK